jgi:hypothetical protein
VSINGDASFHALFRHGQPQLVEPGAIFAGANGSYANSARGGTGRVPSAARSAATAGSDDTLRNDANP